MNSRYPFVGLLSALFALGLASGATAQVVTFDTSGLTTATSILATFNATQQATGVSGTPQLSRTGLTSTGGAAGSFFSNGANITNTLDLSNKYVGYTVVPSSGEVVFATAINWTSRGSASAPNSYATAYSTDAFATSLNALNTGETTQVNVARAFNITDLITNDTLAVRFYNYGATSISGGTSGTGGSFRVISPTITGSTITAAAGNIALSANTEVRNSGALALGGIISGGFNLDKNSTGTLTFDAANTYSGATSINAGTLLLSATGSINSSATITVGSGATLDVQAQTGTFTVGGSSAQTLQGLGTVTGGLVVGASGTIRADSGAGLGSLNTGNLTVNTDGAIATNLGASGTSSILVTSSGSTVALQANSKLNLESVNAFDRSAAASWNIATLDNAANLTGDAAGIFGTFVSTGGASGTTSGNVLIGLGGANFNGLVAGDTLVLQKSGTNLVLNFAPVPEPGTILAISAGVLGLGAFFRKKFAKSV